MELASHQPATNVGTTTMATLQHWSRSWRRLSRDSKLVLVVALLAASVAAAIVVILWTSSQQFVPLYGKQELYDKANILELLEKQEFRFRLDSSSGDVLVREDQLAQARMALAAQGVKAALPAGLEGLDQVSALGTSQFMESARYLHAVEGELARTIIALDSVRSARVHLAMPKRTLFVGRDEEKPTAAVMLDLVSGRTLEQEQVEAVVNLVAGSVPGMKAESVSVVDQAGRLLSAGLYDQQGLGRLSVQQLDYARRLEATIAQRASDMLYPLLGPDNFRVQVAADVDFSAVEETRKSLDDKPVLISESSKTERSLDALAMGIPGALSNRPPVTPDAAGNNQSGESTSQREETDHRFDIGSAVTHVRQQQGRLRNLSVSVLINTAKAPAGGWPEAELDKLGAMLKTAVGFNGERGDEFSLQSFNFSAAAVTELASTPQQWWQDPIWQTYLRYVIGGLMVLALIQFGVRPLVAHLIRTQNREGAAAAPGKVIDLQQLHGQADEVTLTGAGPTALPGAEGPPATAHLPPPGSEFDVQLKHLRLLVDTETARVTEVIKQWMHSDAR